MLLSYFYCFLEIIRNTRLKPDLDAGYLIPDTKNRNNLFWTATNYFILIYSVFPCRTGK